MPPPMVPAEFELTEPPVKARIPLLYMPPPKCAEELFPTEPPLMVKVQPLSRYSPPPRPSSSMPVPLYVPCAVFPLTVPPTTEIAESRSPYMPPP